jgi:malonyl CoA-acyl carrier protein transacylase
MEQKTALQGEEQEIVINGVRCLDVPHQGQLWHVGACTPAWRAEMPLLDQQPTPEQLEHLAAKNIWLHPAVAPAPLAIMCGGQGAVWPHMGRELYDHIPVARAAMDRIASIASWDVLSLLDEDSIEVIGQTRWQQPYLFLLEYAQWTYLSSLGLKPALFSGHSLGELIALCIAGASLPENAWNMLDTRARHTAQMEAASKQDLGMMAVHANQEQVSHLLEQFPDLYVSNYNAPSQVIISGLRTSLTEARKMLRKQRVPAMLLNVTMAFHNPAMCVLHNLAYERLHALEILDGTTTPVMSNTTAGLYPQSRDGICHYISVLDEQSVRWVECVHNMWHVHGIRQFLEIGPQDTLCGLARSIEPQAPAFAVNRKGKELEAMRQAVAQLYALGYLDTSRLRLSAKLPPLSAASTAAERPTAQPAAQHTVSDPAFVAEVMDSMAQSLGLDRASLRPEQDLRHDLGLRSSRFPLLLQDVEQHFSITISFSDMLDVLTVGDFAQALADILHPEHKAERQKHGIERHIVIEPMRRYAVQPKGKGWLAVPAPVDPHSPGLPIRNGDVIVVCGDIPPMPQLYSSLAAEGCNFYFAAPPMHPMDEHALHEALEQLGATVAVCSVAAGQSISEESIAHILSEAGTIDGLIYTCLTPDDASFARVDALTARLAPRWRATLCARPHEDTALHASLCAMQHHATQAPCPARTLMLPLQEELGTGRLLRSQYAGDMLKREFSRSTHACVLWSRGASPQGNLAFVPPRSRADETGLRERPDLYPFVYPDIPQGGHFGPQPFAGACQFSLVGDTRLAALPPTVQGLRTAPAGYLLEAILEAACQHLPWLTPIGFADIQMIAPLPLPQGITRECRLSASTSVWFHPHGHLSRFCPAQVQVRDITEDGRRKASYSNVCNAFVMLAPTPRPVQALWPSRFANVPAATLGVPEAHVKQALSTSSIAPAWRFLRGWQALALATTSEGAPAPAWVGNVFLSPQSLADNGSPSYTYPAPLLEALLQFVQALLPEAAAEVLEGAEDGAGTLSLVPSSLSIGFLYFDAPPAGGAYTLEVRRTYLEDGNIQFDAQAFDAAGRLALTCSTLGYTFVHG